MGGTACGTVSHLVNYPFHKSFKILLREHVHEKLLKICCKLYRQGADGHGVLVLVPAYPVCNNVLL